MILSNPALVQHSVTALLRYSALLLQRQVEDEHELD